MNLIKRVFDYIDYFVEKFNICFEDGNKYYSAIKNIQNYCTENDIVLDNRAEIEQFIYELEVPCLQTNIFKICNPNVELLEDTDVSEYKLDKLNDSQLLEYLMFIFSTVTFNENDKYILLKYNIIIWNTGFHKFARLCRGKIFDKFTKEIVSYPFDKFFNVNEVSDTKEELVKEYLKDNRYVYATDKKDGSTISITKYKNDILVTTNGSFDNDQIDMAKKLLNQKYTTFLSNIEEGYTYIFELIHPENKIILDYGDEKALYLLSVRDLSNYMLLSLDEIHQIADKFNFPYPDVYSFNNLDDILYLAHNLRNANKEGWVLRIGAADGNEYMLKIKLDEYFELHSAFDKIKLSFVYRHLLDNDLDDFIAIATEEQRKLIDQRLDIIQDIKSKIKVEAIAIAEKYLDKHNMTYENFYDDREKMITFVKDILSDKSIFKHYALHYVKHNKELDILLSRIKISHMKNYAKYFGYDYNN